MSTVPSAPELRSPLLSVGPNPMRSHASLFFAIAQTGRVRVTIVDLAGREVAELTDEVRPAGRHRTDWNGSIEGVPAAAGIYFARVETTTGVISKKLALLR